MAIDGIRDLVSNINDPDEGTKVVTYLNKWVDELNIHISVVLHVNKADEKPRGHIGTEIQNRAESVIIIKKTLQDKNTSIVEPQDFRGIEFSPFAFSIAENRLPYVNNDYNLEKD